MTSNKQRETHEDRKVKKLIARVEKMRSQPMKPKPTTDVVKCPYCWKQTGIGAAAIFETVFMAKERCEHCGLLFLIVHDVPMTREQYENNY